MLGMEPGRSQRQFVIHHCLGRGGYGEVYRATMVSPGGLRSDVALKLLRVDVAVADDAVRRLKDEGRMLGLLRHPAILRAYDLAVLDGRVGLVTEYVEGQDLLPLVSGPGSPALPTRCLVEVASVVADVLEVAWSHPVGPGGEPMRLVHRDIKPSNIRLGRHGEVKVLDFGIARSTSEQVDREARTGTNSTVGSLAYMAPERFTRAPAAPAADVFGLGCVLFEGLAGRRLFVDPVPVEMFRLAADASAYAAHLEEALGAIPVETDPEIVGLLRRMLAHAAAERPTAGEVRVACDALAERLPGLPLRKWAREREWPGPSTVPGFLDGRTITEGTMASTEAIELRAVDDRGSETFRIELPANAAAAPAEGEVERPSSVRRSWPVLGLGLVAVLAVGWFALGRGGPVTVEVPVPVPVPVPLPGPTPEPAPVALPTPEPAPVVAPAPNPAPLRPTQSPRPRPAPPPVPEPEPEPAPVPAPEPLRYGQVRVQPQSVTIELRGEAGRFGPGRVPVASGYELFADFGAGSHSMGRFVDVVPDVTLTVRCNTLRQTCDVDR